MVATSSPGSLSTLLVHFGPKMALTLETTFSSGFSYLNGASDHLAFYRLDPPVTRKQWEVLRFSPYTAIWQNLIQLVYPHRRFIECKFLRIWPKIESSHTFPRALNKTDIQTDFGIPLATHVSSSSLVLAGQNLCSAICLAKQPVCSELANNYITVKFR